MIGALGGLLVAHRVVIQDGEHPITLACCVLIDKRG